MAATYRHSGKHIPIASASGAIANGALVYQEGWFGIATKAIASGASGELDVEGVHKIAVPVSTVTGSLLYFDDSAESTGLTLTLTNTANQLWGKAVSDRDADGNALVKFAPQGIFG